jgi:hypothetical protein
MVIIGCASDRDRGWLGQLLHRYRMEARTAEDGEMWQVFVDPEGNVRGGGQVITCGLDRRCTLTASSLLQEGGLATLQRTMYDLQGREIQPREVSLAGLPVPEERKLSAAAVLLLLGMENRCN